MVNGMEIKNSGIKKQVNILISTYNGERYIEDQIDSIKKQTYPFINIYVRDDGSTDRTVAILQEYEKKGEIILFRGSNIGYGRSFLQLLKCTEEGDYWAFCDQDDVWLPQKVEWSLEWLNAQESNIPLLVGNSYQLVSKDLRKILGVHTPPKYKFDFRRALTDCLYQGFVITFNGALRKLMLEGRVERIDSHDWWANILVEKFGKAYFDPRIAAMHRRLDESMSVMTFKNKLQWLKKTFKTGNSDIKSCAKEYSFTFGRRLNDRDSRIAKWFTHDTYDCLDAIKKAFYPGRWRPIWSSEITIRLLMLLGKI